MARRARRLNEGRCGQLRLPVEPTWGGRRLGAGRKPSGPRAGVPHRARPAFCPRHPVHVTLRSVLGCLRTPGVFPALACAIGTSTCAGFRVIHFSVQADHVHLLIEALDRAALHAGIRGLLVRTSRAVNRRLGRSGPVWIGRYHRHDLRTPREVRNGLCYVLQNWKKHIRDARGVDPFSSGPWFNGWKEIGSMERASSTSEPSPVGVGTSTVGDGWSTTVASPVDPPRTWLARTGWKRHGLISLHEAPGSPGQPRFALLAR